MHKTGEVVAWRMAHKSGKARRTCSQVKGAK